MSKWQDAQRAARQRRLELEWTELCRRNRRMEAVFCVAGGVFLGLLAKFYWWPPQTMILLQVCALLIVLGILVILAMSMVRGAWREWRRYRMIADAAQHRGAAHDAADRDKWRLVRDFFREKRP